jgi:hypothetical protein
LKERETDRRKEIKKKVRRYSNKKERMRRDRDIYKPRLGNQKGYF